MRDGQRPGRLGHDPGAAPGVDRACRQKVLQGVAGRPLHHDVGTVPVVLDVEDLGQPGVIHPAGRPGGGDDLADPRKTGRESEDRDGPRERFVDRLPGSPASGCGYPVLKPVPPAEAGTRFRGIGAHKPSFRSG